MNESMKEHIHAALRRGVRLDGRSPEQWRDLEVKTDVTKSAEGSAHVKCGNTEVIVGVKLSAGTPFPDRPNSGVLMVGAELRPLSHPDFETGPPSVESIEVARVIDRGIRESKTIDEASLCIKPGEKVWIVNVDICPINYDGNVIDCGTIGALAALKTARFPKLNEDGTVDYMDRTQKKFELRAEPLAVTVAKIGETFLVDPLHSEEAVLDAWLMVTTLQDGSLCAMQKGGKVPLTIDDIDKMVGIALEKAAELRSKLGWS